MKTMKRISRRLLHPFRGKESGVAFVAVLTFLVIGALIIAPLLGFMFTGMKAGQAHERRTQEFYSADAGVQYAIYQLQYGPLLEDGYVWLSNPYHLTPEPLVINNDLVDVWVEDLGDQLAFRVSSTATDNATGSATTVTARIVPESFYQPNYLANGVTSVGDISVKGDINGDIECAGTLSISGGTVVNGDVKCDVLSISPGATINGDVVCGTLNNQGLINGIVKYYSMVRQGTISPLPPEVPANPIQTAYPPDLSYIDTIWPTEPNLTSFYLTQVLPQPVNDNIYNSAYYYPVSIVNTPGPLTGIPVGALGVYTGYTSKLDPRNLSIDTKDSTNAVKLTTTVFVTGDFSVTPNTKLDLNGQAIYVLGTATFSPGSVLTGSGVIIAIGAISFQPSIVTGGDSSDEAVILHYDGTAWARQDNPYFGDLNDLWGLSANEVYAVGNNGLVLDYDGSTWNRATTLLSALPSPPNLNGVWCNPESGDVFAVGDTGTTLHYDASAGPTGTWTTGVLGTVDLNDIWGSASDNVVYAVGDLGVIWRWKDGSWDAAPLTNDSIQNLHGVWGSEAEGVVFAVGDGGTIRRCADGATWSSFASGTLRQLNAIWGISSNSFYVVGDEGTIRYWNGSYWIPMSINSGIRPQLRDIWGSSSSSVWAVGEQGTVIRYAGTGTVWTQIAQDLSNPLPGMYIPTTRNLNSVWGNGSNDVFAVGQAVKDFVFVQSVNDIVKHLPGGDFYGSVAGKGECTLQPGGELKAPSDLGRVPLPEGRYLRIESYIIDQH